MTPHDWEKNIPNHRGVWKCKKCGVIIFFGGGDITTTDKHGLPTGSVIPVFFLDDCDEQLVGQVLRA